MQLTAQIPVTKGSTITIDFNSFDGSGLVTSPATGQLDSDDWRITGFSDGDGVFGGTHDAGDFARGIDGDGVTSGGLYAFEVAAGDFSLGTQPTGSDWNPGTFDLRLINNSGTVLTEINIQYDIYVLNNADRSGSFNFSYSADDINYTSVASIDFSSAEAGDVSPVWQSTNRSATLSGLNIANGELLYLRWQGEDISGSGSRDEFGLDNILISGGDTPLPVELNSFKAFGENKKVILQWTTAAEINNRGFIILRADENNAGYTEIGSYANDENLIGAGTSSAQHNYTYIDKAVLNDRKYWYKLVDVDFDGTRKEHGPISATPQITDIGQDETVLPNSFVLYQNFPNPFNPSTTIAFDIPLLSTNETTVNISVYNILGQKINELLAGTLQAGRYSLKWDGRDQSGKNVPAGLYIYEINTPNYIESKKMMYLK